MGADLIIIAVPIEHDKAKAKQKLRDIYSPNELLDTISNEWCVEFDSDDQYAEALAWVDDHIDCVYDYYENGSREVTIMWYKDAPILLTGGMSWGDDPTDAYHPMSVVATLGLTEHNTPDKTATYA